MQAANPGPWVDFEKRETAPWLTHDGVVKFIEFPVRIPAMSHRAFHLYWQRHHSPNVMNVTPFAQFMRKYNSGHRFPEPMDGLPAHYNQSTDWEGAAEVWVNSWREVGDWLGHPLYASLIQPDEPRFIAQDGRVRILVGKEERVKMPAPDWPEEGRIKLYLALSRRPSLARPDFHAALSAHAATVSKAGDALLALTVTHRLADPSPIEGLPETDIDAVVEFWFASREMLRSFTTAQTFQRLLGAEREFSLPDKTRAVVARMRVVHDEFSFQPSTMQPIPFTWSDA